MEEGREKGGGDNNKLNRQVLGHFTTSESAHVYLHCKVNFYKSEHCMISLSPLYRFTLERIMRAMPPHAQEFSRTHMPAKIAIPHHTGRQRKREFAGKDHTTYTG